MIKKVKSMFVIVFGLIILLVWLAILQYKWLDEVSEAQRKQIKETVQAAAQNISSDFNRKLSNIHVLFQYLNADSQDEIIIQILRRLQKSEHKELYQQLVNHILIYDSETEKAFKFSNDFKTYVQLNQQEVENLKNRKLISENKNSQLFINKNKNLDLESDSSYLVYSHIKSLKTPQAFNDPYGFQNPFSNFMKWRKKPKIFTVLVELNQETLKNMLQDKLIPFYLGSNANELYDWSIKTGNQPVLYNKSWPINSDSADVQVPIGELNSNAVIYVQSSTNLTSSSGSTTIEIVESLKTDEFNYQEYPENPFSSGGRNSKFPGFDDINPDSVVSISIFKNNNSGNLVADYQLLIRSKSG